MRSSGFTWLVCALLLAALLVFVGPKRLLQPPEGSARSGMIGGTFSLVDSAGNTVTDRTFHGQYMLVYFGFTHCPDICPTTLFIVKNALDALGEKAQKITPVFVSLDPERDTPQVMGRYVGNFGTRVVGLTGTPAQVRAAAEAYRVHYSKVERPDSAAGYLIDHSGFLYLMDPRGNYIAHFPHTIAEAELAAKLSQFVQ